MTARNVISPPRGAARGPVPPARGRAVAARHRITGLVACVVAVAAVVLVFNPPQLPWQRSLTFKIAAPAFSQLGKAASVDLAGKQVGKLQGLTMSNGTALLTVRIDGSDAHLIHSDASATIRPHGLLGTQFIDLNGGSKGTLHNGAVIPPSRVHVAVTLDQVLNVFQSTERQNLQTLVDQLGVASSGRGKDLNQTLKALSDTSDSLKQVTGTVRQHDQGLDSIISSSQRLNQNLQYAPLDKQIKSTDQVLTGIAGVDGSLGSGIDHTANVLSDLDVVMNGNSGNLRYTLRKAPQVTAKLRTLLSEGNTLLKGVNPALPALMTSVVEAESAFNGKDANGHYVRVMSIPGTCTVGLNTGCSGGPGNGGPPVTTPSGGSKASSKSSSPSMSDRGLMNLLYGGG